ncbi:hypothetical protein IFM89_024242 [Coptis chinensis]|uniref:Uncharacterized protein n=1 Tax=Coptis chinensis TaxID=261450 RepID=A0A835LNA6_9MAGN|nr:hypothetical protein IFM89_024242 [Coptis chinensis]
MSLSITRVPTLRLPMLLHQGKSKCSSRDRVKLGGSHLIETRLQARALGNGEAFGHTSRVRLKSVLQGPDFRFSLFETRRNIGIASLVQSAAALCASAITIMPKQTVERITETDKSYPLVSTLAGVMMARCATETQTVERKSSTATISSPPGKEMLPMLDDGGSGFRGIGYTPYYRGDGNGGDSGGGRFRSAGEFPWWDFWFYIFMFLLHFLMKKIIGQSLYQYEDGRNKPLRRYV